MLKYALATRASIAYVCAAADEFFDVVEARALEMPGAQDRRRRLAVRAKQPHECATMRGGSVQAAQRACA